MKKYIKIFLIFFVASFIVMPLRGGYVNIMGLSGVALATIAGFILLYPLTLFMLRKYQGPIPKGRILLLALSGALFFEFFVYIVELFSGWNSISTIAFVDFLSKGVAIILAYFCFDAAKKWKKVAIAATSLLLFLCLALLGYPIILHKQAFGTFTGNITLKIDKSVTFYRTDGTTVDVTELEEEYVILDFWNTTCGICYKKFPILQKLHDQYAEDPRVGVYAVHCWVPEKEDYTRGTKILSQLDYTFPSLTMDAQAAKEQLDIERFPVVLICRKGETFIFRGTIENACKKIEKELMRDPDKNI